MISFEQNNELSFEGEQPENAEAPRGTLRNPDPKTNEDEPYAEPKVLHTVKVKSQKPSRQPALQHQKPKAAAAAAEVPQSVINIQKPMQSELASSPVVKVAQNSPAQKIEVLSAQPIVPPAFN